MSKDEINRAERFRVLKEKLNWPATHIMEYIDAGYTERGWEKYYNVVWG